MQLLGSVTLGSAVEFMPLLCMQTCLASSPELLNPRSEHTHCVNSSSNAQGLVWPTAQALWATTSYTAAVAPAVEQVIPHCNSHSHWTIDACRINELDGLLQHREQVLAVVEEEADEIAAKFGSDRRTVMSGEASSAMSMEDIIPNSQSLVVYSKKGYIKRIPADTFAVQNRGGKGMPISTSCMHFPNPICRHQVQTGTPLGCLGSGQYAACILPQDTCVPLPWTLWAVDKHNPIRTCRADMENEMHDRIIGYCVQDQAVTAWLDLQ